MGVDVSLPGGVCVGESQTGKSEQSVDVAATGAAAAGCVARWTDAAPVSTAAAAHRRSPPFPALTSRLRGISRCHRVLKRGREGKKHPLNQGRSQDLRSTESPNAPNSKA